MKLSSIQLQAFFQVSKDRHFSRAAQALSITQSALSQRIQSLEDVLESKLLVRGPKGVELTEAGIKLLKLCQIEEQIEEEFLEDWQSKNSDELRGQVRIGAYSSVYRSILMPSMAGFIRTQTKVHIDIMNREMRELPQMLKRGEVDMILLDHIPHVSGVISEQISEEEVFLVESERCTRKTTYLDHDANDHATLDYFKKNGKDFLQSFSRMYLDDIYGIIDGVKMGWGRAVVPKHLIANCKDLKKVSGFKSIKTSIYLIYAEQPYYPRLHKEIRREIKANL